VDPLLLEARRRLPQTIGLIRELVECETPSGERPALRRFNDLLADRLDGLARVRTLPGGSQGPHLRCEFVLPGRGKQGRILALGHSDTVWPAGTLKTMPFLQSEGRLYGPGVFDMKSGLALFIAAMRILRDLDVPVYRHVTLQVNSDEEIGSPSSRARTEEIARQSIAVLVLEPAAGATGALKTARKGVGDYTVTVRGVAAHAGLDFEKGSSAIVEMARQIERIAGFTRLDRGITVSPGVIRGGSRANVVAAECSVDVDVRVPRARDARYLERCFRSLKAFDQRCTLQVEGGLNRPPLEPSAGGRKLFRLAAQLGRELGVELSECAVGGASDGNFTAALGIPTLDGLGAVGEGAHAPQESVVIGRLAERSALLAKLVSAL
jgi:glutamate carboxypeptidase